MSLWLGRLELVYVNPTYLTQPSLEVLLWAPEFIGRLLSGTSFCGAGDRHD